METQEQKINHKKIVFILIFIISIYLCYKFTSIPTSENRQLLSEENSAPTSNLTVTKSEISYGEAIFNKLSAQEVPPLEITRLTESFKGIHSFKLSKPGDTYTLYLNPDKTVHKMIYQAGLFDIYVAVRVTDNVFSTYKEAVYLNKKIESKEFVMETSLYDAIVGAEEKDQLVMDFAQIFSWDIDFYLFPRQGDRIKILYEKYTRNDQLIKYGRILAAEYVGSRTYQAIYFTDGKKEDYYDLDGKPLRKMFLKMPLDFGYLSSAFSLHRLHPIAKIYRAHTGTDYASYYGAPVKATADGYVSFAARKGGYGNLVILRHPGNYETYYGHNSRIVVKPGQYVKQGQIIAKVGSTGYSTGPHVHYEVRYLHNPINPQTVKTYKGVPLSSSSVNEFKKIKDERLALLNTASSTQITKAVSPTANLTQEPHPMQPVVVRLWRWVKRILGKH